MKCAGALTRKARNRRRQGVLTGEGCVSSEEEDDVVVGKMKEKEEEEEGEITVVAGDAGNNVMRAAVAACGEESVTKQWPALLQSKCEVLEMEKELAMQRWTQQCMEIAKTAPTTAEEMSHCVMQATKRRGTVSAPCTPRTTTTTTNKKEEEQEGEEEDSVQLVHRIEQLQKSRQQRELENQANAVQGRVQLLQQRSKTRYGGVRIVQRNKENLGRELDPSTLITKGKTKGEMMAQPLQETHQVNDRTQKETIDKIVTQGMLKRVKGEMKTLQQKCDSWEQRALHAESKCATLEIQEESWRVQAQLSEQKNKELEREMAQVRAKMEEVKSHAALEQSRLIPAGCNHSYALVLKPVLRNSSGDICTCSMSPDFQESKQCEKWCHMPITRSRPTEKLLCNTCTSKAKKIDSIEHCMGCGSVLNVPNPRRISTPRIQHLSENSARKVCGVNDTQGARRSPSRQSKLSSDGESKSNDGSVLSSKNEMTISEIERSMAQNWFKQRQSGRRPNTACSDTSLQENNADAVCSQPNPTRCRSEGKKSMKSRQSSASKLKVSTPHLLFQERLPLKEASRNAVYER
ncbi:hypothetical protein CY35_01G067400 [Sphagnum magellanicum]|nr:hypothetical protein CY35_01G067400 [Sphagnum magellanicum]